MAKPQFEIIESDDVPEQPDARPAVDKPPRELGLLLVALKALSQRAIAAIADCVMLATVGSAFWLCLTIHEPTANQLIEIGGYFLFVLAANWIVRRK